MYQLDILGNSEMQCKLEMERSLISELQSYILEMKEIIFMMSDSSV